MKIYAASFLTESNTFSPLPTGYDDFNLVRAEDVEAGRRDINTLDPYALWQDKAKARGDDFTLGPYGLAQPSGLTVRRAYEAILEEIIEDVKQQPSIDIVLLMLHGAMVADGFDDCEGDTLEKIRAVVGPNVTIAVELDLHCHLTEKMRVNADIMVTFKEYPHVDINARAEEVFDLAIDAQQKKIQPTMAYFDLRMMGMYPTSTPKMRELIVNMVEAEQQDSVLSVSFGHGFPFGDVVEAGGKVLVVTDNDLPLAEKVAKDIGLQIYQQRAHIGFKPEPMEQAFQSALDTIQTNDASSKGPVVIADQSDNPGGGAPADSTYALRWLLDNTTTNAGVAIMYDPEVVKFAKIAGVGANMRVRLGGKLCPQSGEPLDLEVQVLSFQYDYKHRFPQDHGDPWLWPAGDIVALRCQGIDIIVSSIRCQCFSPCIFADLGIDALAKDLLVVKSSQHFYSGFGSVARKIIYMAAEGAVPTIVQKIPYQKLDISNMYPWVEDPYQLDTKETNDGLSQ